MARNSTTWKPGDVPNPEGVTGTKIDLTTADYEMVTAFYAAHRRSGMALARKLGVSPSTWARLVKRDERLKEAIDYGIELGKDRMIAAILEHGDRNVVSLIYASKVLYGLSEEGPASGQRVQVNITIPAAAPSLETYVKGLTIEQAPKRLKADRD